MSEQKAPAVEPLPGFWSPLRLPAFRRLWFGNVASNVGGWMQTAGAGWLMTDLAPPDQRAMFVAGLAIAGTCPVFLFGFPAGVLADRFDRRRYILCCQAWMMVAAIAMAVLAWFDALTAWALILLVGALGIGNAMNGPAWHAVVPEIVGRAYLPQAIALNSAGFNMARTVGPVIGQLVQSFAGTFALFATNAVTFCTVIYGMWSWRRPAEARAEQRKEGFWEGFRSGIAFVRETPALWRIWARAACFFVPACGLSTLLPLIGRDRLELNASEYGILFSTFGVGAVAGTMLLPRINRALGPDRANIASMVVAAVGMLLAAAVNHWATAGIALTLGGGCWMVVIANNNVATQNVLPSWVRARGMAVHQIVFFGSLAIGQTAWGIVASRIGVGGAIACAGGLLLPLALAASGIRLPTTPSRS